MRYFGKLKFRTSLTNQLFFENKVKLPWIVGRISPAIFGVNASEVINTHYFRIKTGDALNNTADWSNPVSASYINPELYQLPVSCFTYAPVKHQLYVTFWCVCGKCITCSILFLECPVSIEILPLRWQLLKKLFTPW